MPLITIENLKYRYPNMPKDVLALDGVSLTVEKGEFIGIVGQNGAGKSTLSQALIGLVPQFHNGAYGGRVTVAGQNTETTPVCELCKTVGLVFQNPFNQLSGASDTVEGEIAFGLQNLGIPAEEMNRRIDTVMKQLDITQFRGVRRNPFDLSGGQMQRVAIAGVLVMEPEVVVLDEPTSQLDPQGTEEVFKVVEAMAASGKTILMIEQKLEKLASYCDRIVLMHKGKIIAVDTPEKIFSREDLADYGVQPPAYTRFCRELGLKNPDGTYPVTLENTVKRMEENRKRLPKAAPAPTAAPSAPVFTVSDLDFAYPGSAQLFCKLALTLDHRTTAIIGQNGAGKTTLVRLLKGLLKPLSGSILFGTEDITKKTVAMLAGKVGYVFQNPDDQIFKYNVLEEVMFGPMNIGMTKEQAAAAAKEALAQLGMEQLARENPYDLELNQRKMVAIASVVAMNTDVVIFDEPTIAQDYLGKQCIGNLFRTLAQRGKLVIAILHDMDFVADSFERVIVMAHGRCLADGTPEEVFAQDAVLEEARLQKPCMTQLRERFADL